MNWTPLTGITSYAEGSKRIRGRLDFQRRMKMGKMKTFNVAGVAFRNNPSDTMRRIDMISRYCGHGSTFELQREPKNEYSKNAIAVRQVFKSGGYILLGYVPDNKKNSLAKELAPLMDDGWEPAVKFGRKFIDEETGECKGLQLRYENKD